jgi:lipoate-protein ligase B
LVVYPIVKLKSLGLGVNEYIRGLEAIGIELLRGYGVSSDRRKGYPGLWVGEEKIASIGVQVKKGVTIHGMAINICNDLSIFDNIVPCGIDGVRITSLREQTGGDVSMDEVKRKIAGIIIKCFSSEEVGGYE